MFRSGAVGEIQIGERKYILLCAADSPLGEIHDAIMQLKGIVVDKMVEAQKAQQAEADAQKQIDAKG